MGLDIEKRYDAKVKSDSEGNGNSLQRRGSRGSGGSRGQKQEKKRGNQGKKLQRKGREGKTGWSSTLQPPTAKPEPTELELSATTTTATANMARRAGAVQTHDILYTAERAGA